MEKRLVHKLGWKYKVEHVEVAISAHQFGHKKSKVRLLVKVFVYVFS